MKTKLLIAVVLVVAGAIAVGAQTTPTKEPASVTGSATAQVGIRDTSATRTYTNFSRVLGTPEELIIDFGFNSQLVGVPKDPIVIDQRIIMN